MWQERQAELLREEIEAVVASLSDVAGLRDLVKEPLRQGRRGLGTRGADYRQLPLLPLIACEAICGYYEPALPIAAARQFLVAAADVFDDIEDADSSQSLSAKYGAAVATNVATTLLILAEKAITRLEMRGVATHIIVHVMDVLNSYYATACAGQHLDLSLASEMAGLEDVYLRVAGMKSASQMECACHIGALLANASKELIDKFCTFGHNLGMASQIANDIQGITQGSDIVKPKITLPVIYALNQTDGKVRNQLEVTFIKPFESMPNTMQIRDALFHCGAIHYATIRMETYKQQAQDNISEVEKVGVNVERLKLLLE